MTMTYVAQVLCCPRDERGFPKWPPDTSASAGPGASLRAILRRQVFTHGWPAHLIAGEVQRRLAEALESGDSYAAAPPAP